MARYFLNGNDFLKMIDLRSDTITRPGKEMLEVMMAAEVGDDVFDEDPTVNALQEKAASMFGMEAALFCPSGTMTNQIAIRILTQPQHEVICDRRSHIYNYEGGGMAYNSMVSVCLVDGDRGRISPKHIALNIRPDDIYSPITSLVCIENTMTKGGGSYYSPEQLIAIHKVCRDNKLNLHLDGARIFNALAETGQKASEIGKYFSTISICLSKGLGAPVGSLLLSCSGNIEKARRIRKVFGGAMRQAGYLAAAGIYALDQNIDRLKDDHRRAKTLGLILKNHPNIASVLPVDTNIVIFKLKDDLTARYFVHELEKAGILSVPFGHQEVRFVTHLDFDENMLDQAETILKSFYI
jgi:threonine aldolase